MWRSGGPHRTIMHAEWSVELLERGDKAGNYRQAFGPERRVGGGEAKRREQLAMPYRAARLQHREIARASAAIANLIVPSR